jgi:redox-sensitive bicupin YhaK (pirin superfamily)
MKTVFHKAEERGNANHGWLHAKHSFSFAHYYNPEKMHFGALRVLNDDIVKGGKGFGTHPHENMEIITVPLQGALEHKDSTGGHGVISKNDIQVMSAGIGVYHSEYNHSKDEEVNLLQIWIFPKTENVTPRYDQKTFSAENRQNKFETIVAPDNENAMWIHQDAWLSLGNFSTGTETQYTLHKKENGIYAFLIEGSAEINGIKLAKRDALGIWDTNEISVKSNTDAEILLIEVPMMEAAY